MQVLSNNVNYLILLSFTVRPVGDQTKRGKGFSQVFSYLNAIAYFPNDPPFTSPYNPPHGDQTPCNVTSQQGKESNGYIQGRVSFKYPFLNTVRASFAARGTSSISFPEKTKL